MRRLPFVSAVAVAAATIAIPIGASARSAADLEVLRLECAARTTDDGSMVRCEWSKPQSSAATAIKLYRYDPAVDRHRMVVFRTGDLSVTAFVDEDVRAGHRYGYGVVAFDGHGRVVARSRPEWVSVPLAAEVPYREPVPVETLPTGDGSREPVAS